MSVGHYVAAATALLALAPMAAGAAAGGGEVGFPSIQVLTPEDIGASTQNFGVAQDSSGVLYFANLGGLIAYDGAGWRRIDAPTPDSAVVAVAADRQGRLAVASLDQIGVLTPDASGALRYRRLADRFPGTATPLGFTRAVAPWGRGFAFLEEQGLLLWDGVHLAVAAAFSPAASRAHAFRIGEDLYVWIEEGLFQLVDGRLRPFPGGALFRRREVTVLLPRPDGALLAGVRGEGLFTLAGGRESAMAPAVASWARAAEIETGCALPDGRLVLGSRRAGILLIGREGAPERGVDASRGLPDNWVRSAFVDREGATWLAFDSGLARLETTSPLSTFDSRVGLEGTVNTIARHRGELWIGASSGLYRLQTGHGDGDGHQEHGARVVRHTAIDAVVFALFSTGDSLLVGTRSGMFEIGADLKVRPVAGGESKICYLIQRSEVAPAILWVGLDEGLAVARRTAGAWRIAGTLAGSPRAPRAIVEAGARRLWIGSSFSGVVRADLPAGGPLAGPARFTATGKPADCIYRIDGQLVIPDGPRLLCLDPRTGQPLPGAALARVPVGGANLLALDARGNLWFNSHPPAVAWRRAGGSFDAQPRPLVGVPSKDLQVVFAEGDGVVWLGGEHGLVRYEPRPERSGFAPPPPLVRRVSLAGRDLVGDQAGPRVPQTLPPHPERLRVEFAPASYAAGLTYQVRLEPVERGWTPPRAEPFVEFTNLGDGAYRLHLRTLGPGREAGPDTVWAFRVAAAWYRTPWAWIAWVVLAVALLGGLTELRNRTLTRRAVRLQAEVDDKTRELLGNVERLRQAQAEVVDKNRQLEAANARLEVLSLHDELTGLANRRFFQQRLQEEWNRGQRQQTPLALVLFDLDRFKNINDTWGHVAGDRCLGEIGAHLRGQPRRPGDLLARFGGEEFALLLTNNDVAGAQAVAEQLRREIEALGLARPGAAGAVVTASFGVAAATPRRGQDVARLLEAADAALYRAKQAGRNRTETAGAV
ncbi:MAG TPA: diguanylate cyclase [Thermoanaerobaculia bacterium]|nr:diguanylate cyclase [Thermoanaerobaculia bacterium]